MVRHIICCFCLFVRLGFFFFGGGGGGGGGRGVFLWVFVIRELSILKPVLFFLYVYFSRAAPRCSDPDINVFL